MTNITRTNDAPMTRYTDEAASIMERVLVVGDLSKLQPMERVQLYNQTCKTLGLNPLTRPFEYINLNGKLTLYARKDATDQLRAMRGVSVAITHREHIEGVLMVTARATLPDGRNDESIGAVSIGGLKGEALANAYMKAETKAKRRVTLSICGLGWLDESEVASVPQAQAVNVDTTTGEIIDQPRQIAPQQPTEALSPRIRARIRELETEYNNLLAELSNAHHIPYTDAKLDRMAEQPDAIRKYGNWLVGEIEALKAATTDEPDPDDDNLSDAETEQYEASEAETAFWTRYGQTIGTTWQDVQAFYGAVLSRPTTDEEWKGLDGDISARLNDEAARTE